MVEVRFRDASDVTVQANQRWRNSGRGPYLFKKKTRLSWNQQHGPVTDQLSARAAGTVQTRYHGPGVIEGLVDVVSQSNTMGGSRHTDDLTSWPKKKWCRKVLEWQPRTGKRSVGKVKIGSRPTRCPDDLVKIAMWIYVDARSTEPVGVTTLGGSL